MLKVYPDGRKTGTDGDEKEVYYFTWPNQCVLFYRLNPRSINPPEIGHEDNTLLLHLLPYQYISYISQSSKIENLFFQTL